MSTFYLTKTGDDEQLLHEDLLAALTEFLQAINAGAERVELVWSA